jgi:hypothetical protein
MPDSFPTTVETILAVFAVALTMVVWVDQACSRIV